MAVIATRHEKYSDIYVISILISMNITVSYHLVNLLKCVLMCFRKNREPRSEVLGIWRVLLSHFTIWRTRVKEFVITCRESGTQTTLTVCSAHVNQIL
jgi:hypothetical protein